MQKNSHIFVYMGIIDKLFSKAIDKRVNNRLNNALTSLYNRNVYQFLFDGGIVLSPKDFDYVEGGYEAVAAVFECVDLIVNKIIACPRIVYKIKDQKEYKKYLNYAKSPHNQHKAAIAKIKALEETTHKEIDQLLLKPNKEQNLDEVLEMIAGLLVLTGNSYLYGNSSSPSNKKWSEIWAIPSEMNIKSGGLMEPVVSYEMLNWLSEEPFPAAQIKHFKTRNLNYTSTGQQLFGMPPLKAYLYSLDILRNADKQSDKQIKNGGKLGIVSPENREDNWNEPQIAQIGESMKDAYRSNDELGRTVPMSVSIKYTEIGMSSQEMELLKTANAKAEDVYRCYHVPLQFRNQDTATYNNLPVSNRQLIYNAVYPWLRKVDTGLTEFICEPYNTSTEKYVILSDYTSLPELSEDAESVAKWLDQSPFLTLNEKREAMGFGKLTQPGTDEIFLPSTQVRLQDIMDGKISATHTTQPPATT